MTRLRLAHAGSRPVATGDTAANDADTDVAVVARAICRGSDARCGCDFGADCVGEALFGVEALQAVVALRAAGRLVAAPPAAKPCLARSDTGACLSCGVKMGEPCQHPATRL